MLAKADVSALKTKGHNAELWHISVVKASWEDFPGYIWTLIHSHIQQIFNSLTPNGKLHTKWWGNSGEQDRETPPSYYHILLWVSTRTDNKHVKIRQFQVALNAIKKIKQDREWLKLKERGWVLFRYMVRIKLLSGGRHLSWDLSSKHFLSQPWENLGTENPGLGKNSCPCEKQIKISKIGMCLEYLKIKKQYGWSIMSKEGDLRVIRG